MIAAAAAEKELETVVEEAARRAGKGAERFLAACVEDAAGSGGEEAEAKDVLIEDEDEDDGDAEDVGEGGRRRGASSRRRWRNRRRRWRMRLAGCSNGETAGRATDRPRVAAVRVPRSRGGESPVGVPRAERRVARSNADLFERSGFRQRYIHHHATKMRAGAMGDDACTSGTSRRLLG